MSFKTRLLKQFLLKKAHTRFDEFLSMGGFTEDTEGGGLKSPSSDSGLLPLIPIVAVSGAALLITTKAKAEPAQELPTFLKLSKGTKSGSETTPTTFQRGSYVASSTTAQSSIVNLATSFVTVGKSTEIGSHGTIQYSQTGPRNPYKGSADCSSFVRTVYKDTLGIDIGGNSDAMWNSSMGVIVDYSGIPESGDYYKGQYAKPNLSVLQPGDVLFFSRPNSAASAVIRARKYNVMHVGIYMGDDKYVDLGKNNGPWVSQLSRQNPGNYLGAKRYITTEASASQKPVRKGTVHTYEETDIAQSSYNRRR